VHTCDLEHRRLVEPRVMGAAIEEVMGVAVETEVGGGAMRWRGAGLTVSEAGGVKL
jgi:hypothetical protein